MPSGTPGFSAAPLQQGCPFLRGAPGLTRTPHCPGGDTGSPGLPRGPGSAGASGRSVDVGGRQEAKSALTGTLVLLTWQDEVGQLELSMLSDAFFWNNEAQMVWFVVSHFCHACPTLLAKRFTFRRRSSCDPCSVNPTQTGSQGWDR